MGIKELSEKPKKKHKPQSFKQMKKSENAITQIDIKSYYVKSETEPDKEPYLVYNSDSKGWICDCMWWSIHFKNCKHIDKVISSYFTKN